jgi:hypothetical protein
MMPHMACSSPAARPPDTFMPAERTLIRHELSVRFGTPPSIAEGIFLRTWRSGPQAGRPKLPPAVKSLLDRGLLVVRAGPGPMARAHFTSAGLAALRQLAADRRGLDPVRYAHIHQELDQEQSSAAM